MKNIIEVELLLSQAIDNYSNGDAQSLLMAISQFSRANKLLNKK